MKRIEDRRIEIYNHVEASAACQKYFHDPAHEGEFVAYYNSMFLLQDTTEGLQRHREKGFSADPLVAYVEFWGVMQAVIIQQDSIAEICELIIGRALDSKSLVSWSDLRDLRNICAGHPVRKDRPKTSPLTRSFIGRSFGDYDSLIYERWELGIGTTHPDIRLGVLLDSYEVEAESQLSEVIDVLKSRWP